jgi:hypothetical protein
MSTLADNALQRTAANGQPLLASTRWLLRVIAVLVFLVGIPLYTRSAHTASEFAWTIKPPLTAAFMGAGYWAACLLATQASMQRTWVNARLGLLAASLFTVLMLTATLIHLDKFHTHAATGIAWIVVYVATPIALAVVLPRQMRVAGGKPPRLAPMSTAARSVFTLQAAVMVVFGVALFVAGRGAQSLWPWLLTPLTARAIGAWLIGLGAGAALAAAEADWLRVGHATGAYALLGALQGIALARYSGSVRFAGGGGWIYAAAVLAIFLIGVASCFTALRSRRLAS